MYNSMESGYNFKTKPVGYKAVQNDARNSNFGVRDTWAKTAWRIRSVTCEASFRDTGIAIRSRAWADHPILSAALDL